MGNVMRLPKRDRAVRESDIIAAIRRRVGALEWVVLWRNNTGTLPDVRGIPVTFGLCKGSSDFVGIVSIPDGPDTFSDEDGCTHARVCRLMGRFVALEVKRPGERPRESQDRFLHLVRKMGGFATWVTSADDAIEALHRARDPRHDR